MCDLIHPAVDINEVETFIWRHIVADLSIICQSLGKSTDDALLLLHSILQHIMLTDDNRRFN